MKYTEISVIIPIHNEESTIPILNKRLVAVLKKMKVTYEVIYIDDGSYDKSFQLLEKIHKLNKSIKLLSFSRNFGHMAAVEAGLKHTKGVYTVIMDGDLQDPPELIPSLYKKAKRGFKVVYGVKHKRKEGIVRRLLFNYFYKLLNTVAYYKMPADAGTFSIIHKDVVAVLSSMPERNKYISGLRAWAGYKQAAISYERDSRYAGKPATLTRLVKLALDGIFSFSYMPLKLASIMGFIFAFVSFIFIVLVIIARFVFNAGILGWASTLSAILFIGAIQLITLGIIGEYLARIYDEVKARPTYLIQKKLGIR